MKEKPSGIIVVGDQRMGRSNIFLLVVKSLGEVKGECKISGFGNGFI